MANQHEVIAEHRADQGKGASRRLRHANKIPAVLYGAKQDPINIQFDHHIAYHYSQNEWFYSSILNLTIEEEVQKVLLRDMQRHPFKAQILHMDFQRVSENEVIHLKVSLHFLNQEKSPAGKTAGIVVTHEMNEVEIACLPKDLPEFIEIDLTNLDKGDTVHLSDLVLPAGVTIPALRLGKEHDLAVVVARQMREEVEAVETPEALAPAPSMKGGATPVPAAPAAGKTGDKKK